MSAPSPSPADPASPVSALRRPLALPRLTSHVDLPARPVWAAALLLAGVGALIGHPVLWLVAVTTAVAVALPAVTGPVTAGDGRRSVVSALPGAGLVVAAVLLALALAAGVVHWPFLAHQGQVRWVLFAVAVVLGAPGVWRARGPLTVISGGEALALAPALGTVAAAAWVAWAPLAQAVSWVSPGGDNSNHLAYVQGLRQVGWLKYDTDAYPRAWHVLDAAVTAAGGDGSWAGVGALWHLLRTESVMLWLLWAVLVAASGLAARAVAARLGARQLLAGLAGLTAGTVLLSESFLGFTFHYGFVDTGAFAALAAVGLLEVVDRHQGRVPWLVAGAAVALTANSWQLGLPLQGMLWLGAVSRAVPAGSRAVPSPRALARALRPAGLARSWRKASWARRRAAAGAALVTGLAAVLCLPPLAASMAKVGVGAVTSKGGIAPLPLPWAVVSLGVCALGALAWLVPGRGPGRVRRAGPGLGFAVAAVLVNVAVAVVLSRLTHASLTAYYLRKVLWHSVALALPLACAALVPALAVLDPVRRAAGRVPVLRGVLPGMLALAAVFSLALTATSFRDALTGGWMDARPVIAAVQTPGAQRAGAVWRATSTFSGDVSTARMIALARGQLRAEQAPQVLFSRRPVAGCAALGELRGPVLSGLGPSELVVRAWRCPAEMTGQVPWLRVPGAMVPHLPAPSAPASSAAGAASGR